MLRASLEDKDEELEYLQAQQGDGGHEEELLQRTEEDDHGCALYRNRLNTHREDSKGELHSH